MLIRLVDGDMTIKYTVVVLGGNQSRTMRATEPLVTN